MSYSFEAAHKSSSTEHTPEIYTTFNTENTTLTVYWQTLGKAVKCYHPLQLVNL